MTIAVADVRAQFPEFAGTPPTDLQITNAITLALDYLDDPYLTYRSGVQLQLYLTAHYLYIALQTANGDGSSLNPEASKSVGQISVSYTVNNSDLSSIDDFFNSTSYGQTFYLMYKKAQFNLGFGIGIF